MPKTSRYFHHFHSLRHSHVALLLHYGVESEKENVLNKIYYDRSVRLAASGIKISKTDFKKLVV